MDRSSNLLSRSALLSLLTVVLIILSLFAFNRYFLHFTLTQSQPVPDFIASIDTMKVSRDRERYPLDAAEITTIVQTLASLHVNYITVDTHWEYPDYMRQWVQAIHDADLHVWFRSHPNQWENQNGANGLMNPTDYLTAERNFLLANADLFQSADIFDPCPEPEQGLYWQATHGDNWTAHAPNHATAEFNRFLRDATDVADTALRERSVNGVITTVRSTNSFFATHRGVLEEATVKKFGRITVDSYPEQISFDPEEATRRRIAELEKIYALWQVPIVVGEMGYNNSANVDDLTQQAVLKAQFSSLERLSYIRGTNYWVGPGSVNSGGYTYIMKKDQDTWTLRPAAQEVAHYYAKKVKK